MRDEAVPAIPATIGVLRRTDCPRCASAGSIEYGVCQVCLTSYTSQPRPLSDRPDREGLDKDRLGRQRITADTH